MEVYLIMSNNGARTKVSAVVGTKEKAIEYYNFLDSNHSDNLVREVINPGNIKFYSIQNDVRVLKEHLFIEKRQVM